MTERSNDLIKKTEDWINKTFPEARWYRHDELIIEHTMYMWVIDLRYLHMVIGFNDLDYKFSAAFEVLMEEEDGDDLIKREYNSLNFDEFMKAVEKDFKENKNRISAAKYLVETIRKQEREEARIDFVNKIVEDSGV